MRFPSALLGALVVKSAFALPFTILPQGTLPTVLPEGGTVLAYYTVANKTTVARLNNYLKYLPDHVVQTVPAGLPGVCANPFSLSASGNAGESCTLALEISGPVGVSEMPHQNLFVCFPGGKTCAGTYHPLSVKNQKQFVVTAGIYNPAFTSLPLIGQSSDGGTTWTYNPVLPGTGVTAGQAMASSCYGSYCVTVGDTTDGTTIQKPYVARSDGGSKALSFPSTVITALPANFGNNGIFRAVHCFDEICAAVGSYQTGGAVQVPLVAYSNDAGKTWAYPASAGTLPGDFTGTGILTSVVCSPAYCVASGQYTASGVVKPLIVRSGTNWSYTSPLPADFASGATIESVHCLSSVCVVAGAYTDTGAKQKPFLVRSPDGATWTFPPSVQTLPASYNNQAVFHSVSCQINLCLAGGYFNTATETKVLLAKSTDAAATWTYQALEPADVGNTAAVETTYCTSDTCFVAGSYVGAGAVTRPIVAVTHDNGGSFAFSSGLANLPADFQGSGILSSLSCSQRFCVATGKYSDGAKHFPLVARSTDNGLFWKYEASAASSLPSPYADLVQSPGAAFSAGY